LIAKLDAEARNITATSKVEMEQKMYRVKIDHQKQVDDMRLNHEDNMANVENEKFERIITAVGSETLQA